MPRFVIDLLDFVDFAAVPLAKVTAIGAAVIGLARCAS